jgi:tetratricopeptide (TPR) repeat protein
MVVIMPSGKVVTFFVIASLGGCSLTPHGETGFRYLQKENYPRAETELKKALASNPNDMFSKLNLGAVYQRTGRNSQAIAMYNDVVNSGTNLRAARSTDTGTQGQTIVSIAESNLKSISLSNASR